MQWFTTEKSVIKDIISTGPVTFVPADPRCELHIFRSGAGSIAFVEALDTGAGKSIEEAYGLHYFGHWNDEAPEECLMLIMRRGSHWKELPVR